MMFRKFILLFISLCSSLVYAQEEQLKYTQNFTISDGLTHNGVTCVLEDSKGFTWIGTYDGLNRYDGYEFFNFKNTLENHILISNRVRSLFEDQAGNIWIGTDDGITVYNYSDDRFFNIYSNKLSDLNQSGPIVQEIKSDKSGKNIICSTETDGVLFFNSDYTFIRQYIPRSDLLRGGGVIKFYEMLELENSRYLFATSVGLLEFDLNKSAFKLVIGRNTKFRGFVHQIQDNYIITTQDRGIALIKYEFTEGNYKYHLEREVLSPNLLNDCSVDSNNNIWFGTMGRGILKVDNVKEIVEGGLPEIKRFSEEWGLRISTVKISSTTGCWVGSYDNGLYRFKTQKNPFNHLYADTENKHSFLYNNVISIAALDNSRVFICTLNGGVGFFNISKQNFEPIPFDIPSNRKELVKSVFVDSQQNIWFQYGFTGLFKVQKGSRKAKLIISNEECSLLNTIIFSYSEDKYGAIWMGAQNGLVRLSFSKKGNAIIENINEHPVFNNKRPAVARNVYADPANDFIWFAMGTEGFYRIKNVPSIKLADLEMDHFIHDENSPNSLSSNFVSCFKRLPNGELWVGTEGGGVCKVTNSEKEPFFTAYTEKDGLSNHAVKNIHLDTNNNLWISTNNGINKYDIKQNLFRSFKTEDSLPFEDFNYPSVTMPDGHIVISGYHGVVYFKPSEVRENEEVPRLEFDELKIYNELIRPGIEYGKRVLLKKRLAETAKIELKHDENSLSIGLKSLHYSNPQNHMIKYRLQPVNKNWILVPSNQGVVNYNELRPGEYVFKAMVSNSVGEWSDAKEFLIVIKPPFWKTAYAMLFYVFFIGVIILIVFRFRLSIHTLRHKLEIEHLEKEKENEVNEARLRYFSNISHEIKTPLTLISGPVGVLAERLKGNQDLIDKVEIVQRQSKKITQLIDQVHDFQRSDAEMLKMNYSEFCFDTLIHNLVMDFEFLAKNDRKKIEVRGSDEKIYVSADKDKLEKVLNNLLNNAFKYTNANDSIQVSYFKKGKELVVRVTDTGRGIEKADQPHVFERFYQSRNKKDAYIGGSGIGLAFSKRLVEMHLGNIRVESEYGKGSTFTISLPVIVNKVSKEVEDKERLLLQEEGVLNNIPIDSVDASKISIDESLKSTRLFLVEDNSDMRNFVSDSLSQLFEVKSFVN